MARNVKETCDVFCQEIITMNLLNCMHYNSERKKTNDYC